MSFTREVRGNVSSLLMSALLCAVLFYSGFLTFLFAVPVQVAYTRHGDYRGLATAGAAVLLILAVHSLQAARFAGTGGLSAGLIVMDVLMPLGILAGLSVFNLARQYPWWLRLLAGSGIALLAAFPSLRLIATFDRNGGDSSQLRAMLAMMGVENNWELWADLVRRIVLSSIGVALTAGIAANFWLGNGIVKRTSGTVISLRRVRVPEQLVWMVIAGLAIIVITWIGAADRVAPIGWNLALVGGFLFAIQGVGIIQHLLHRRGVGSNGERWVLTIALIALFIPGMNIVVAGGLPLLGISEVWVDYKRGERYEGHTE
jgi:hypothetical protein